MRYFSRVNPNLAIMIVTNYRDKFLSNRMKNIFFASNALFQTTFLSNIFYKILPRFYEIDVFSFFSQLNKEEEWEEKKGCKRNKKTKKKKITKGRKHVGRRGKAVSND